MARLRDYHDVFAPGNHDTARMLDGDREQLWLADPEVYRYGYHHVGAASRNIEDPAIDRVARVAFAVEYPQLVFVVPRIIRLEIVQAQIAALRRRISARTRACSSSSAKGLTR